MEELLSNAAGRAIRYLEGLKERRVFPARGARELLAELEFDFPQEPTSPEQVLATLDEIGSPATVASAGGRYTGRLFLRHLVCGSPQGGQSKVSEVKLVLSRAGKAQTGSAKAALSRPAPQLVLPAVRRFNKGYQ